MDAREYLEQYQTIKRKIERLYWTIEELQALAEGGAIKLDGLPHGTGLKNPMEHFILRKIEKEQELQEQIELAQDLLVEIETNINKIENQELANLLHYRYVEGLKFDDDKIHYIKAKSPTIVDRMGYSRRNVFYMHDKALKELQHILNTEPILH